MCCPRQVARSVPLCVVILAAQVSWGGSPVEDLLRKVADRLEQGQVQEGPARGSWPSVGPSGETYSGPAITGMVSAYKWFGDIRYDACAWRGGYYLIETTDIQGNVLGDEAYAFLQLSDVYPDGPPPDSPGKVGWPNIWYDAVTHFYVSVRDPNYEGSTAKYLEYFDDYEPSVITVDLAHHVVASYSVKDVDRTVWRDALVRHLARVDDDAEFPILALAAATWALSEIGGLDPNTLVSPEGAGVWDGVTLADLPSLLLSQVMPEDGAYPGSLFCRFDHGLDEFGGPEGGYTEDAVFGLLGLVSVASRLEPGAVRDDFDRAIEVVFDAVLQAVDEDGVVYQHVTQQGDSPFVYAGELLQASWSVKQYQDAKLAMEQQQ